MTIEASHRGKRGKLDNPLRHADAPVDTTAINALFAPEGPLRHAAPGCVIVLHGTMTDKVFQVVSGVVRCCTISEDGRRQIFSFKHRGDYLGLADLDTWHYTAEAVDHVVLRSVSRERLEAAIETDAALRRAVRGAVAQQLCERERQLVAIAYMSAEQRLLHFLRGFAARRKADGFLVLPMTRQDIGDHLGLTLETVSRAFGTLRRKGLIEMRSADRFRLVPQVASLAA